MAACSSDDNITAIPADGDGIPFSATISIDGNGQTRAYTSVSQDGYIDVEWRSGEQVAFLYNVGSLPRRTIATVTSVSDGKATISATLNKNVTTGTPVTLIYPFWNEMFDAMTGDFNPHFFGQQSGLLTGDGSSGDNSISHHFDLRKGTGTITLASGTASLSSDVTMESQIAVWKLTLKDESNNSLQASTLEVDYKGVRAYATPSYDKSEFYMAVPAVAAGESSDLFIIATKSNGDKYFYSKPGVTLTASTYYQSTVKLNKLTVNRVITPSDTHVTLVDGDVVSGTGGANTQLKIADGATVMLSGVTNTGITQEANIPGIDCLGDATIILVGTNRVTGRWNAPGIFVPEGKTLTIKGGGTLNATGGSSGAGIGGTNNVSCGNIVIASGTVTATSTGHCAGIGSGYAGSASNACGDITISGGTVTATGGDYAAGIGSGYAGFASNACGDINTCGDITISGGTVTATGGVYAAGIGSGNGHNDGSNIFVSACGVISITGGTVKATGGNDAAGIGSGSFGSFASISIGSGITRVTATRSNNNSNVPIGKGYDDRGSGAVTFGNEIMHNGNGDGWDSNSWTNWPETGGPFDGIQVSASVYGNNGRTWTLTPAP